MIEFNSILALFKKDLRVELRQPQFFLGVIFFQLALLLLFFFFQDDGLDSIWWANIFWVNILIASLSLVLKNFSMESSRQFPYYFQITNALTIYISKVLYNFFLLLLIAIINYLLFFLLFDVQYSFHWRFLVLGVLGVVCLSLCLTMVSFIAGYANHSSLLVNILVVPVIVPLFLILIRSTEMIISEFYVNWAGDVSMIIGIAVLMLAMGIGLFPYLWRR